MYALCVEYVFDFVRDRRRYFSGGLCTVDNLGVMLEENTRLYCRGTMRGRD